MLFTHWDCQGVQRNIVASYNALEVLHIYTKECLWEFNISPPIWQTYINTILNCLESRKYCEAIIDDLLLFTPSKQSHMRKLEDLLKALLKNGMKISPKNVNYSEKNYNIWVIPFSFKRKECVLNCYAVD